MRGKVCLGVLKMAGLMVVYELPLDSRHFFYPALFCIGNASVELIWYGLTDYAGYFLGMSRRLEELACAKAYAYNAFAR